MNSDHVTRRDFVRDLAVGGLGTLASAAASSAATAAPEAVGAPAPAPAKSRVAIVRHEGVIVNDAIQPAPLAQMIDRAVMEVSGQTGAEAAWAHYFKPGEVVGIKVNGRGGSPLATALPLIQTCVERLKTVGVKPENIIIWEMRVSDLYNCGFTGPTAWGAQVLTADVEWDQVIEQGSFRGALTAIVTKRVDAILNLPILKDHHVAGVTMALKNHYGSISNPMAHHANGGDPYIADLNTVPALRAKQRLILCDGTRGQAEGGPHYSPGFLAYPKLVMAATDPVAHDWVGWQLIETQRKAMQLPPLARVGRPPSYLHSAAQRGLGTDQADHIDQREVTLT